jgi:hypothetical protein
MTGLNGKSMKTSGLREGTYRGVRGSDRLARSESPIQIEKSTTSNLAPMLGFLLSCSE